ncbi:MAG TPA: HNH endonuclease signature motif containing protein [Nitrosarchaeum sp.]|nr:HNH endonuclease signature motif containing protein [Nitrosarchaeum sp.]
MKIKLNGKQEGYALVSRKDYDDLSQYKWHQNKAGYAQGHVDGISVRMHRYIMQCPTDKIVDHINGNKLDNRRSNLRICTQQENTQNVHVYKTKQSSRYRCVFYDKTWNKWYVQKCVNKKMCYIGAFKNELDAAEAFDIFLLKNNINISLNFPEKKEEYLIRKPQRKLIGVHKRDGKNYLARITVDGTTTHILRSKIPEECANAYDEYIIKNNILGKKLNFPEKYPDYDGTIKPKKEKENVVKTLYESLDDETVRLLVGTSDKVIKIDREDYERIKYYKCGLYKGSEGYPSICLETGNKRLHRFIMMEDDPAVFIDHIDNNKLNITKGNLRKSNAKLSAQNRGKLVNKSSQYIGVSLLKSGKWCSCVTNNRKIVYRYNKSIDENSAARRRDLYILLNYPDSHYKLNFEWTKRDVERWSVELNM